MVKLKRKAISFILVVMLIVTNIPLVSPVAHAAEGQVIIHYYSETKNPYVYYWNSLPVNIVTDYPGVAMTADSQQGDNWYSYTFDGCTKINMLFTNSDGSQVTGNELTRYTGEWWYKNGRWYNHNPDEEKTNQEKTDFREETVYNLIITRFNDGDTNNNVHCWDDGQAGNPDSDPAWRGDFKGLEEKLDYIKALGFSAVSLTPVAQNASGYDYHGWHPINLKKIDSRYESDGYTYEDLVNACHDRGMKVMQEVSLSTGNFGESNLCPIFEVDEDADASNMEERMVPTESLLNAFGLNSAGEYWTQIGATQYNQRLNILKNLDYSGDNGNSTGSLPEAKDYEIGKLSDSPIFNPLNRYHSGYFQSLYWDNWTYQFCQLAGDMVDLNTENPYVGQYLAESMKMYADAGVDAVSIVSAEQITSLSLEVNIIKPLKEMLEKENLSMEIYGQVDTRYRDVWYRGQAVLSAPFYTWSKADDKWTSQWMTDETADAINNNMNLAFDFIKENNDVTSQPTSDNAFLNGITYHTPDYTDKFMNVRDFPMMYSFGATQSAFQIALDGDKYYNDATWNMTMYENYDYSYEEDQKYRSLQSTDEKAEKLSLMFTFRGIPTLLYGDEVEFKKGSVLDVGPNAPLEETGRAYYGDYLEGNVTATDFSEYTASGTVADTLDSPLSQHIIKLNAIRRAIPALQKGQYTTDSNYVEGNLAFIRRYTNAEEGVDSLALVTISNSATFKNIPNGTYIDAVTGDVKNVTDGTLSVSSIGKGNMRVYVCCASGFTGIDGVIGASNLTYLKSVKNTSDISALLANTHTTKTMALQNYGIEAYAEGNTVYCQNDAGWNQVYCYMWNSGSDNNGVWPGVLMTDMGDGLWSYEIDGSYENIIFNSGSGTQTGDLSYPGNNALFNNGTNAWSIYDLSSLVVYSIDTDFASPQYKGTDIVITAIGKTGSNTEISYRFSVDGIVIQDFSTDNTCSWTADSIGTSTITVDVKDGEGNTNTRSIDYVIKDDSEVVGPILKGVSPKTGTCIEKGKSTDITIKAGGGNIGTNLLFYKYIIKDPDGNIVNTPYYSLNNTFSIKPEALGEYTVYVYVQGSDNGTVSRTFKYTSVLEVEEQTTGEQTPEKPTVENPTMENPTTEKPTTEKPTTEETTTEETTTEEPTTEEPTTEEPTTSPSIAKVGAKIKDSNGKAMFKVTSASKTNLTVEYTVPVNKKSKSITVPATIKANGVTYKVTSIAGNAFKNNQSITSITVGSNIKTIGVNAFSECKKLTKVTIGKNVTSIGDKAFYKCTSLKKITIPSKISKIGKQAFYGCKKLKSITIKTTKLTNKKVGKQAFKGINAKATIKVPKSKLKVYKKLLKSKGVGSKAKIKK